MASNQNRNGPGGNAPQIDLEDADFHQFDTDWIEGLAEEAGPIKHLKKEPGRIVCVQLGNKPPPLVRSAYIYIGVGAGAGLNGTQFVNLGNGQAIPVYIPAVAYATNGGCYYPLFSLDYDVEISEFTIGGPVLNNQIYLVCFTGPGK